MFLAVMLPIMSPARVSGWRRSFALSLDKLAIGSFVSEPGASTLPMIVVSMVRLDLTPKINALATLMMVEVGNAVALAAWPMRPGRS